MSKKKLQFLAPAILSVVVITGCKSDAKAEYDKCRDDAIREANSEWKYSAMLERCGEDLVNAKREELAEVRARMSPEELAEEQALQASADAEANSPAADF